MFKYKVVNNPFTLSMSKCGRGRGWGSLKFDDNETKNQKSRVGGGKNE
jgi:hypothetical protein